MGKLNEFVIVETFFFPSRVSKYKSLGSFFTFFFTLIFIYLSIVPLRQRRDIQLIIFVSCFAMIRAHDTIDLYFERAIHTSNQIWK